MIDLDPSVAGTAALLAAVATVVGAVLLGLFFAKGQPWGTLNDVASIIQMIATVPVALYLGQPALGSQAALGAGTGVAGMVTVATSQLLLVLRVRTYRQLLPWTLGAGAVVGVWYLVVGATLLGLPQLRIEFVVGALLALASGVGYIALGYGFWRGHERHPVSIAGGIVVLVASTTFLGWFWLVTASQYAR